MAQIPLIYAHQPLSVTLPDAWVSEIVSPRPVPPAPDGQTLVARALEQPVGTPWLARLREPGQTPVSAARWSKRTHHGPEGTVVQSGAGRRRHGQGVAIVVDDYTRKTPVARLLPVVLDHLQAAGVRTTDIRLVVAPGTHRPMTPDELVAKVGPDVVGQYEIVNIPSTAGSEMVYLGTASNGIPAWVNRAVADADVRIALGMITPHMDAGYSGGAKMILPGVCSSATVDAFHAASAFLPVNQLGNIEAPLRRCLEQFVTERVPLDLIVNVIVTLDGDIYQCVAGDPVQAHRAGVAHAKDVFGVRVKGRYPVVVANCYPYDVDLWQSAKGAFCGDLLTADGGTLVLVAAAPEGNSTYPLVPYYAGCDPDQLRQQIRLGQVEDAKQAVGGLQISALRSRLKLALVSSGLTRQDAAAMGIAYFDSVEDAVAAAVGGMSAAERRGSVAVIPQAGTVLPLVS